MGINQNRLTEKIGGEHKPFIVYNVETTGCMNGNNNKVTQIALASYEWNKSAKRYELQDHIFMLAKPDPEILRQIQQAEKPTADNVYRNIKSQYEYEFLAEIKSALKYNSKQLEKYKADFDAVKAGTYKGRFSATVVKTRYETYLKKHQSLQDEYDRKVALKESLGDKLFDTPEFDAYAKEHFDEVQKDMKTAPKLEKVLQTQGLDLDSYIKEGKGLDAKEMQTGIAAFLKKYDSKDTYFITNGTYYQNHYLAKEGMKIDKDSDHIIDYAIIAKEQTALHYYTEVVDFADAYFTSTGKKIETFDAFTKALCYAEMAARNCNIDLVNRSLEHLTNEAANCAFNNDDNYVMSLACMANKNWTSINEAILADYTFDSLQYVEFGNDRRYVDLDKMFEVNNNFEITLEGDKTPIKSWEELENKIKALNSHISPDLLDRIKTKYMEIENDLQVKKGAKVPEKKVAATKAVPKKEKPQPAPQQVADKEPEEAPIDFGDLPLVEEINKAEKEREAQKVEDKPAVEPEKTEVEKVLDLDAKLRQMDATILRVSQKQQNAVERAYKQMVNVARVLLPEMSVLVKLNEKGFGNHTEIEVGGVMYTEELCKTLINQASTKPDEVPYNSSQSCQDLIEICAQNQVSRTTFKQLFDKEYIATTVSDIRSYALDILEKELKKNLQQEELFAEIPENVEFDPKDFQGL